MRRFQSRVVDANNSLVSAANVTVYAAGTSNLASLFSGEGLVVLANPFKSDHLGVFEFYVEGSDYDIAVQDPVTGFARRFYDISIFDVRDVAVLKSGDSMQGQLRLQSGSLSEPGLGFVGDTDTGFYRAAPDTVGIAAGGADTVRLRSDGVHLRLPITQPTTPLMNESFVASLDQAGLKLWFYAKDSGGTLRSGSVGLA